MRLDQLLLEFQKNRVHLAMLLDEYGSVVGMVTLENVLEELVGPIQDEFDREPPQITPMGDGVFEVEASCPLDVLAEQVGLELPETDAETAGGLILDLLGRLAKTGRRRRGQRPPPHRRPRRPHADPQDPHRAGEGRGGGAEHHETENADGHLRQRDRRGTMQVSLFITCFNDTLFPGTGRAVVSLLERLGHTVDFPMAQTCCGQMHYNTGYQRETIPLVRHFVEVFRDAEVVVSPSASCVGMVHELYPKAAALADDAGLARAVERADPAGYEFSTFLVNKLGVEDVGAYFPHRVTFHPTCHSQRMLRIGDAPQRLLRRVRGIDLVELPHAEECCGFGGTFSVKNADTSMAMLSDKIRCVLDTGAEYCAAADNSCLMHIGGALHRQRAGRQPDPPRRDPRRDRERSRAAATPATARTQP